MQERNDIDVLVSEVGPRDGLQSIKSIMPTAAKKAWIAAEAAAGVREIEVCSFVPAKLLPQMADAAEVVRYARTIPGLTVLALVPNFKGAENAIQAGAHKIALPLSASETHSKANLRKTHDEVIDEVRRISELLRSLPGGPAPRLRRQRRHGLRLHARGPGAGRQGSGTRQASHGSRRGRGRALRHHRLCLTPRSCAA
ncbi:MAG: hypothetical protein M5R42_10115 [Rhodocyclaceae bacterium]|nr:hypothetical protein [Rhodocyclaceae bacterium]